MDELVTNIPAGLDTVFTDYRQYKKRLDLEIKDNAEGFVRIGYLLKIARDTDILAESNYKTLAEFALAEYGLTKDIVSRYIAVNDRYSQNGYSDQLADRYKGYGIAKLAEMLTLSDEIIAEIGPSLTRREIQEIKKEIAEEEKITPIEAAIEAASPEVVKDDKEYSYTQRIWKNYLHENRDVYKDIACEYYNTNFASNVQEAEAQGKLIDRIAPNGTAILFSRIPGVGKIMISVDGEKVDEEITYTNTRTNEKEKASLTDAVIDIADVFGGLTPENWLRVFGEPFEKPAEEKPAPEPAREPKPSPALEPVKTDKENPVPKPDKFKQSTPTEVPENEDAANRQQDDGQEAAVRKDYETPVIEEENEKVAPVQQPDEEAGMNPPVDTKLREYNTRPLNSLTDVKNGDRLVNINTGETADVLGYCIGDIKAATDHGVILVSAPNSIGWMILEENEKENTPAPLENQEDENRQQDTAEPVDTDKMEKAIIDAKMEFEDVYGYAYDDGFTIDGLQSMYSSVSTLKNKIDELLRYHLMHNEEENEDDGI